MLKVKVLSSGAKVPTVGHPNEDLAYDIYALEDVLIPAWTVAKLRTGIAAMFDGPPLGTAFATFITRWGLLIKDRSSMAAMGFITVGGVIDSGFRGEINVVIVNFNDHDRQIMAGDKIAQMIPVPVMTGTGVQAVQELPASSRGDGAFGSTGQ